MSHDTKSLLSLSEATLARLATTFDRSGKPNWRTIISFLPKEMYTQKQVELFGMACLKPQGSPTKALLQDLGKHGKTVSDLIQLLQAISSEHFDVSTAISLLTQQPLMIITQPMSQIGIMGEEMEIGCEAVGTGPLTFTWFRNTERIEVGSNAFKISSLSKDSAGYYICRVSNAQSFVFSDWALIDVVSQPASLTDAAPLITRHPRAVICNVGGDIRLFCDAIGNPEPDFQWYFHEQKINKATQKVHIITKAKLSDTGLYSCVASNGFGTARTLAAPVDVSEAKKDQAVPRPYNWRGGRPSFQSTDDGIFHGSFPRRKVALLVGNENYVHQEKLGLLVHPLNDTREIAGMLASIGFTVVSLADLSLREFKRAVSFFCQLLSNDVYAVFYFAGHGFEVNGNSYLMPVDATESFCTTENYSASEILSNIVKCKPQLTMLILDCCRTTPTSYLDNPIPGLCHGLQARQGNVVMCFACCSQSRVLESPMYSNGFFAEAFCKHVQNNILIDVLLYEVSNSIHKQKIIDPATGQAQVIYRHSSLVEPMSLCDPILPQTEESSSFKHRFDLWRLLHKAPTSPVSVFQNDAVRLDFIFSAEFSNVLLIQSQIHSTSNCSVQFFMPSSIGGARVDILKDERYSKEGEANREVVKISNLECLEGDITVHILLKYEVSGQWLEHTIFYSLVEKPLYAKINDVILNEM